MKKLLILIFLSTFVIGCSSNNQSNEPQENEQKDSQQVEEENDDATVEDEEPIEEEMEEDETIEDDVEEEEEEEPAAPQYEISQETWSVVPLEEGINENVLLFTIDDAPDNYALEMAKTLKELEVPAIFFVNGHFLHTDEQKEQLKEIHEMGFEISNHTYNHVNLKKVDTNSQREEIVSLNDLVEEIIGERPKFFRAPHGANTDFVAEVVQEEGMVMMNWTYGYDYFEPYMDKEKIAEAMITGEGPEVDVPYSLLKPGANLLMHDREWTYEAIPDIVNGLRDQGYEFVDPKLIKTP